MPVLVVLAVGISLAPTGAVETFDETPLLNAMLEQQSTKGEVLGENTSQTTNPCGQNYPIIGWVDFTGNKVIRGYLPEHLKPSACFKTVEEAHEAGFFYEK